jgi:hypothetical protein
MEYFYTTFASYAVQYLAKAKKRKRFRVGGALKLNQASVMALVSIPSASFFSGATRCRASHHKLVEPLLIVRRALQAAIR